MCSIDASSEIANASMLADLLEQQIDKIGRENVVQVVTNNGANCRKGKNGLNHHTPIEGGEPVIYSQ
jgi:hypothetical protein